MTTSAHAQTVLDYRQNPFGLVYEDAITENVAGKVNIHPVTYPLHGFDIAANVYTPAGYDPNGSFAAIVVAHPNGGIKEQVAGRYAQRHAEQGYITITADAAFQGASGGEPRSVDKPFYRIEDIHGMADFITGYPGVDYARPARRAPREPPVARSSTPATPTSPTPRSPPNHSICTGRATSTTGRPMPTRARRSSTR